MEEEASARRLTLGLAGRARNVAPVLAQQLPLTGAKRLLDVGGGTGIYSVEFLKANPATFKELRFGTRMPQELFDAVCHQRKLVALDIKWGAYEDLSGLEKLRDLRATA